jgi:hypothetical protein
MSLSRCAEGVELALVLRTLGGCGGGCDARVGLPLKGCDPRQKATDLATESGDRCGEGLESAGGGGHCMYSYGRGRHKYTM